MSEGMSVVEDAWSWLRKVITSTSLLRSSCSIGLALEIVEATETTKSRESEQRIVDSSFFVGYRSRITSFGVSCMID